VPENWPENWVDIAILLVVAWNIVDGIRRGFIGALVSLAAFLLSVAVAISFYNYVSDLFVEQWNAPPLLARPVAFAALWLLTSIVVGVIGRIVGAPFAALLRGTPFNLALSIIPSAIKGFAVSAFALLVILAVPSLPPGTPGEQGFASLREAIQSSTLANELVERTAGFDRFAREVVGDPISETLTLLTVRPQTDERVDLGFQVASPGVDPDAEARMLELLNDERRKAGLRPLVRDPAIDQVARAHAVDMLQRGYFAHDTPEGLSPFDRMRAGGVQFVVAGENIALAPTVTLAHQGLMESPGHRANILRPEFGRVGIGAARADGRGRMFAQDFAN
jgi:uncharacterized protein YkwD/uncharacterized membrane protein required for colicin V production